MLFFILSVIGILVDYLLIHVFHIRVPTDLEFGWLLFSIFSMGCLILEFLCALLGFEFDSFSLFWGLLWILEWAIKILTLFFLILIIRDLLESRQRK